MAELDFQVRRDTGVPLGTQLADRLRSHVKSGALAPGDRLPSVRELAEAAGVNVNTVRAVYGRLESEGTVRSEHGRGTFVSAPSAERTTRAELRRQIAELEAELVTRAPLPGEARPERRSAGGRLPSTDELRDIRDRLEARLFELDAERADVLRRLSALDADDAASEPEAHSSTSLRGARVRWVGA